MNFKSLIRKSVAEYGNEKVFIGEDFEKTYRNLSDDIKNLTAYLNDNGFFGKKIGILAHNSYEWVLLFLTVASDLGIIVPLDKELKPKEIETSVEKVKLDFLFYDDSTKDKIENIKKNTVCINIRNLKDFVIEGQHLKSPSKLFKNDYCALFFTSGTSDNPKIVMLSQRNLVSCAYASKKAFKLYTNDRYYTILPLHHTLTLMCGVLVPLTAGCSFCFSKDFRNMQKELKYYQPTALTVVPRILEFMADGIKRGVKRKKKEKAIKTGLAICHAFDKIGIDLRHKIFKEIHDEFGGKIRMIACGGAELDEGIFSYLDDLGFRIYQGYGLTETSPILTIRGMFVKNKIGVGRPLEKVNLKLENIENEVGEIVVKAPQVMVGYYKNKRDTDNVLKNGWFNTGDLGKFEGGNLRIVGRKKNVIISSNGKNIYPEEIEAKLNAFIEIKESIIKLDNKKIVAEIVLEEKYKKDGEKVAEKIIKKVNQDLPDYKRINKYEIRKTEFRKTTTLKIKRGKK